MNVITTASIWKTCCVEPALLNRSAEAIPTPDTGSTCGDLLAIFRALIAYVTSPAGDAVLRAALLPVDDGYADARQAFWWRPRSGVKVPDVGSARLHL